MRRIRAGVLALGWLAVFAGLSAGADYKAWVSLVPETLGGLQRAGDPNGMNMEMDGKQWSFLVQEYLSADSEKSLQLTLSAGSGSPEMQSFRNMPKTSMEMEGQLMKTVEVSGRNGFMMIDRTEGIGTLMIPVNDQGIVLIGADFEVTEEELLGFASELSLDRFAEQVK